MVEEVLCGRERDCWRMRVWGPLPGNPGERGKFVMTARGTGDSVWWEIAPGPQECECGEEGQPG